MNREKLLEVIKEQDFDYSIRVDAHDLHECILEWRGIGWCDIDFYIEWLVSWAGEWETNLYTSYYDTTIHQIILVDEVNWSYKFEDDSDVADFIEDCYWGIYNVKEKLLTLKDNKDA